MRLPLRAQVQGGGRAVHTSTQEWEHGVLKGLAYELEKHGIQNPIISFDHATIHSDAAFQRAFRDWTGARSVQRMPLAPRMPDGNKVADHALSNLKSAFFTELLTERRGKFDAKRAQDILVDVFARAITADSILRDTESLPLTMKIIAAPKGEVFQWETGEFYTGTGGGWPPARHR